MALVLLSMRLLRKDMYQEVDEKLKPLAHACCETLSRYRHLSISPTIMDGNLLDTGEFEVMLSKGLGNHFPADEKQNLFHDAKKLADLLIAVMDRRTKEEEEGKQTQQSQPHTPREQNPKKIQKWLEKLGNEKRLQAEFQWMADGQQVRPGLRQLTQKIYHLVLQRQEGMTIEDNVMFLSIKHWES